MIKYEIIELDYNPSTLKFVFVNLSYIEQYQGFQIGAVGELQEYYTHYPNWNFLFEFGMNCC